MRRLTTLALTLGVLLGFAVPVQARPPTPSCWWEDTTLHGINLPDEWSLSMGGVQPGPSEIELQFGAAFLVYIWTRGGPYEALFRPGPGLNDYKPVAECKP